MSKVTQLADGFKEEMRIKQNFVEGGFRREKEKTSPAKQRQREGSCCWDQKGFEYQAECSDFIRQ